ncbi:hypothetical protein MLD52_09215 [Puniceicoccaceae bacterium K14]|nr:hypothetical protein [Puniceicoccaceae bacterium K14]
MPYQNGNRELVGNGAGWARYSKALQSAPAGTNQAIYIMQGWFDTYATGVTDNVNWKNGQCFGLCFNSIFPVAGYGEDSLFKDFFGPYGLAHSSGLGSDNAEINVTSDGRWATMDASYGYSLGTGVDDPSNYSSSDVDVTNGGGYNYNSSDIQRAGFAANPSDGANTVIVIQVYQGTAPRDVKYNIWRCDTGVDLSSFDLGTDLDPNDPGAAIPKSYNWFTELPLATEGDTDNNWLDPVSGDVRFPTHFMSVYAMASQKLVIHRVGVHYSELTIS